jgi:wyosine [tRNA(Phe)-imidazoG37] synthetase (radical SAM superfamily)
MYKHLFGPVPSRRLGMSLGVDLIPHKICSLNCIYCECGPTTRLTLERKEYVPVEEVFEELVHFFDHHPDPDYITFSGAGEPVLHSGIGQVIRFIKKLRPHVPVAILTNGTLLGDPGVRGELMLADLVMPSLDAATETAFRKINRPLRETSMDKYVEGLIEFGKEFPGDIWLEVLILPGFNDDRENLEALRNTLEQIRTDKIQLNTLDRPGAVKGLIPASWDFLEGVISQWDLDNVEIIAPPEVRRASASYRKDLEGTVLEIISRRPSTLEDLEKVLGIHPNEINKYLGVLEETGKIEVTQLDRGIFYQLKIG